MLSLSFELTKGRRGRKWKEGFLDGPLKGERRAREVSVLGVERKEKRVN